MGFTSIVEFTVEIITNFISSYIYHRLLDFWSSHDQLFSANSELSLIERLQTALPLIKAVMGMAEALSMKDPSGGLWVGQFQLAIEASEDVLDELEYQKLEDMVKNQDNTDGSGSSSKKRKLSALNDDTLKRLKEAVTMLDCAVAEIEDLRRLSKRLGIDGHSESRQEFGKVVMHESKPILEERKVFGREVEMDKIIDWLKRDEKDGHLASFGILGVGGVGKTTLVQFAYQKMCMLNYFDKIIWVCVSTNFSVEDIMRKMLSELGESSCRGQPLKTLQDTLKEKIRFKKILLILDDIWDDEKSGDCKELFRILGFAQKGSKILFTTRMKSVTDMLASVTSMEHGFLALQGLGEKELRMLFYSYAFNGFHPDNHSDLQPFGDQIVKMLLGNPLAAKEVGSLLNSHMNLQYWRRILNQGSLFNIELANDVVEVWKLSYYHLPADLQVCFRFCSIFPRDHKFDKDELIKMWMAVGIIPQQLCEYERPEYIGEYCFNKLLKKSFFEYSKSREGERYVMNNLLHELAQNVSFGECCRIEADDKSITIPRTVRHVYVHESQIKKVTDLANLRSLVITTSTEETEIDMELFVLPNNLLKKSLRLLKINGNRILELPEAISCLVHLRYLSIGLSYISQQFKYSNLPSIYRLYHLQVLEISTAGNNSTFSRIETTAVSNLLKLRYMRFPDDTIQTIRGIHKLTSLQELTFVVGQENGHCINELGTLNNLRHLSIEKIENIGHPIEAKGANLLGKNNLMSLTLIWTSKSNPNNAEKIIDYLQPHSNLKELTIKNYRGHRCPSWMHSFHFWDILKNLHIFNCVNLDQLPDMPLSLIEFRIHNVGLTSLPNLYDGNNSPPLYLKSSIKVVEINNCPNLKSLDGFLQQASIDLQSIEKIRVSNCKNLIYPQILVFGEFVSLKKLTIRDCPMLVVIDPPSNLLHTKLKKLSIANCGELEVPLLESASYVTTLKELSINNCANISCIPYSGNEFKYLNQLSIFGCKKLIEHSVREQEHGVNQRSNLASLKISRLKIDYLSLLCIEPLRSLRFVSYLRVLYSSGMEALPEQWLLQNRSTLKKLTILNASSLKSLPATMVKLTALQRLEILKADLLEKLPELPTSLKENYIEGRGKLHCCSESEFGSPNSLIIDGCDKKLPELPTSLKENYIEGRGKLHCCSESEFESPNSLIIDGCDKLVDHPFGKQEQQAHGVSALAWSFVVENLVSTAYSYLGDRMLLANSEAELKRIHLAIPQIRALMGIVEALKMKDPNVGLWVNQFRLAVEASEDILDEFEYTKLEDMLKNQDKAAGSASSSRKRKISALNDEILKRLEDVVKTLDQAANSVKPLLQAATVLGIHDLSESQEETGKVLRHTTKREMFGREVEKKNIIGWLKQPTDARLSSFGIVGAGGLGKTTLAHCAYQEMHGSNHFDKAIWICVSTNFNVEDITRKMLDKLGGSSCSGKPLNALHETLHAKIHSKKILLILDDVWYIERREFEQLIAPLRFVQEGSKILFTTRMKSVADLIATVVSTEHESLALQGLEEQELKLLFNSYVFNGFNLNDHRDLEPIGDQILKMLQGSPLAAKVIGNLLNSHMDHDHWRNFLNHMSIFTLEKAKDVVEVLKLSYYHLPVDLQVCFRFLSIFPQDHLFDKNDLIKMWIASGFIRQQLRPEERLEDIGEDYFNHLLRKSFLEYYKTCEEERYVMHDLMHELACNISIGECCRIEPNDKSLTVPSTIRHVSVNECEIQRVSHLENLRSLVITTSMEGSETDLDLFVLPNNLIKKSLRLLKICGSKYCELPEEISYLVHLRYLSIQLDYETQYFKYLLPASIYKLYHLQVLEFSNDGDYSGIETTKMTNLVSLRHMRLPMEIMQTIHGIHKLAYLQELTFFVGQESGHRINELGKLNNLRHLVIKRIENIGDPVEAKSANLLGKNNLISLSLKWTSETNHDNPEQIIDYLEPHPNLMELTIENYKGQRCPIWMKNSSHLKLSSFKLFNCHDWKNQLLSWEMPYLKILEIRDCLNIDNLPNIPISLIEFRLHNVGLTSLPCLYESSGNNPPKPFSVKSSLRLVEIESCPNLISLNGFLQQVNLDLQDIEKIIINGCEKLELLPVGAFGKLFSLEHLSIKNCQNLTTCPNLPLSLNKFFLQNVGVSALPDYYQSSDSRGDPLTSFLKSSLREVEIRNCPKLKALNKLFSWQMPYLEIIYIHNCVSLDKLPDMPLSLIEFQISNVGLISLPDLFQSYDNNAPTPLSLKSLLRVVKIERCPSLISLNGFMQQSNLDLQAIVELTINACEKLVNLPTRGFGDMTSLIYLTIYGCPKLVAVDNQINLLPAKLQKLSIENCGKLDVPLLESASSLATLTDLSINNCANITHIPSSENVFRSLNELCICGCKKLVEYSSREQAHGADQGSSLKSLKLSRLEIDHLSLLLIEPLKSLRSVSYLRVWYCSGKDTLPEQWFLQNSNTLTWLSIQNASTLNSLPATMERLTALEWLEIWKANMLPELPELPTSLRSLVIHDASSLRSLPSRMARLIALERLEIRKADLLEELPELPTSLKEKYIEGRGITSQFGTFSRSYFSFAQV